MQESDDHYYQMQDEEASTSIDEIYSEKGGSAKDHDNYETALRKLQLVSIVSVFFIVVQCIGGYMANSIAIFTDTAHLATDLIGFGLSIIALRLSRRQATNELTFGWQRAEIISTLMSSIFLVIITIGLVIEAIDRIRNPKTEVLGGEMLAIAVIGLFFNFVKVKILSQGGDHTHSSEEEDAHEQEGNINVDAAFLRVLSDLIVSIGVIFAAMIIYLEPTWQIADPICTFLFAGMVFFSILPILKKCILILMEGAPEKIDMAQLKEDILQTHESIEISEIYLWSISQGNYALNAHITTDKPTQKILRRVIDLCEGPKYNISHVCIQMEDANDLESTVASDRSFENDQIEFSQSQKFSIKIIDEIFSNE